MKRTTVCILTAALLGLATLVTRAGTNGFIVPCFRGSANSQAGYWETFSNPIGAPGNLPDKPGATTGALLTQSSPTAFLTGSGNIYNLDNASEFTVSNATPFPLGTVLLQTRTLGTELDYNFVSLTYTNESGRQSLAPLPRIELNRGNQPGLGATVSSLWQWDLSGLNLTSYTIAFRAAAASTSFDALTLDTSAQFVPLFNAPFHFTNGAPSIERWMYANNGAPCDRPAGSAFGTFGDDAGVDTRHAQHLVGWDTAGLVPTNRGPSRYLLRRCRLTLTINRGNLFAFDPTRDDFRTYFETNHPDYLPDADVGRPVELFGVGFRNGYETASFDQCAPFGSNETGQRNAYAAGWSTNGLLVDVSNNVGKTNAVYPHFEVAPFAIGQTTNAAPGELVPAGAQVTFDLNLSDPFVLAYAQSALHSGRLRLMVSSLHTTAGEFGMPAYPDFVTHFNDAVIEPTRLELEGTVVSTNDVDTDGLPDDWELYYFHGLTHDRTADPDGDGATNLAELRAGSDPALATSTLRLWPIARDGSGRVVLQFSHAASRQYAVETTEEFQTWTTPTNGPVYSVGTDAVTWTDESPSGSNRFYRVRASVP